MFAIDAIKALAIVLVTHSHMSAYYPIPALATGGLLGNSLFFFASSYGITLGLIQKPESFSSWYYRRIWRIYLPLWIMVLVLIITGVSGAKDIGDVFILATIPGDYWFLPAIALLYAPCYVMICRLPARANLIILVTTFTVYITTSLFIVDPTGWNVEDSIPFKTIYYFSVMTCGIYIAQTRRTAVMERSGVLLTLLLTISFFGFLAFLKWSGLFIIQAGANFLAFAWTIALFRTLNSPVFVRFRRERLTRVVTFLSMLTLQIYLVQVPLVEDSRLDELPFPINIVTFWMLLFLLAWLLHRITRAVQFSPRWVPGSRKASPDGA